MKESYPAEICKKNEPICIVFAALLVLIVPRESIV